MLSKSHSSGYPPGALESHSVVNISQGQRLRNRLGIRNSQCQYNMHSCILCCGDRPPGNMLSTEQAGTLYINRLSLCSEAHPCTWEQLHIHL